MEYLLKRSKKTLFGSVAIATGLTLAAATFWGLQVEPSSATKDFSQPAGPEPKGAGYFYSAKRVRLHDGLMDLTAPTTQESIVKAVQQKRQWLARQAESNISMDNWQAMGPFNVGGRSRAMVFSPADSDVIFSAGVSGGVFKSVDGGQNWLATSDDMENMAVVTLAISEQQPDTIYAGTGEGHYVGRPITRSRGVEGNGIYVSTDAGANWTPLDFTLNNPDFRFVNKLRITPENHLVAATGTGIWRSLDSGQSWQQVLEQSERVGGCLEVEVKPGDSDVLLASCGSFFESAVFRSTNGGGSWQEILSAPDMGRALISFAPSQPETVYILAAQNESGDIPHALLGLYRSNDSGESWDLVTDMSSPNELNRLLLSNPLSAHFCPDGDFAEAGIYGQGWYSSLLTVDPVNPERLWVGTLDLMRSDDGGESFGLASYWWARNIDPIQGELLADSYVHADQHEIVFHPEYDGDTEQRIYSLNDGGIYVSNNPNAGLSQSACDQNSTQVQWQSLNGGYAVNQFYHGAVSSDGSMLAGGMQDNGTYIRVGDEDWRPIGGGDGGYAAFDPIFDNELYISSQFASLSRFNLQDNSAVQLDSTIQEFRPFITPYVLDPNNPIGMFLSAASLWRSDNRGEQWTQISTPNYDDVVQDWLSAIAVQPFDSDAVLVGSSDGFLYRHDAATSADSTYEMSRQQISQGYISSINYHPFNPANVYATVSTFGETHILYSDNLGFTWSGLDGLDEFAFPDIPAHDVIKAPEDDATLYVGSDLGVYVSRDHGDTWTPLGTGFPNAPVEKLVLIRHELQSSLFAFTYGRGAFKLDMTDVVNLAPEPVANEIPFTVNSGQEISIELTQAFFDRNQDPVSLSSDNLPEGVIFSDNVLAGTIDEPGEYNITVIGTDSELSGEFTFNLTVEESDSTQPTPPPTPPATAPEPPVVETPGSSSGGASWYLLLLILGVLPWQLRTRALGKS